MPDPITTSVLTYAAITAATSTSLKNVIDVGQKVKEWARSKNDPDAQQMASDFLSSLLDLQGDVLNLQQECSRLGEELRVAKNHLECRSKLIRRDGYYEFAEPMQGYGKGPFCLTCTDFNGFPISVPIYDGSHFKCPQCGSDGWIEGRKNFKNGRIVPTPEPFND